MTTIDERFAMRARRIMLDAKLEELAEQAGVSATHLSDLERGKYKWRLTGDKVERLAPAYQVEPVRMIELLELAGNEIQPKAKKKLTEAAA